MRELETGFLYMWLFVERQGIADYAASLAEFYQNKEGSQPDNNMFLAWGLVCRFYQADADPTAAWQAALAYLKS